MESDLKSVSSLVHSQEVKIRRLMSLMGDVHKKLFSDTAAERRASTMPKPPPPPPPPPARPRSGHAQARLGPVPEAVVAFTSEEVLVDEVMENGLTPKGERPADNEKDAET